MIGRPLYLVSLLACCLLQTTACGGAKAVRGEDVEGLDDEALSTGLDRRDLQKLMNQSMDALQSSAVARSRCLRFGSTAPRSESATTRAA